MKKLAILKDKGKGNYGGAKPLSKENILLLTETRLSKYDNDVPFLTTNDVIPTTEELTVSGANEVGDLQYYAYATKFPAGNKFYGATPKTVTLDAGDGAFGRVDLIIANRPDVVGGMGLITVDKGTPSLGAQPNNIDYATQYIIKWIFVDANATVGVDVTPPTNNGVQSVTGTAVDNTDPLNPVINASGGSGDLAYQTENTNATTVLSTQKGLTNVYPFNKATAQTIQVNSGVYVENDVVNIERRGQGTVEILGSPTARIRGVRDINNRYFINDVNSMVALLCRGSDEFTIVGRLTQGYYGIVSTVSYSALNEGDVARDVTVVGNGFSSNMLVTVSGNATQSSAFTFIDKNTITLHLTAVGLDGTFVTVTYDNGDTFVDTNAIPIITNPITTANLFAYYPFDNNVLDSRATYNGTATGVTYGTGVGGASVAIDGTGNQFVKVADANAFSFGNGTTDSPFSVTTRAKFTALTTFNYIVVKRDAPAGREYTIQMEGTNLAVYLWDNSTSGYLYVKTTGFTFLTGTWYDLAVTYDGSGLASGIKVSVNKVYLSLTNLSSGTYVAMENGTQPVKIGARWSTTLAADGLDGELQYLGFWNTELNVAATEAIADSQSSGTPLI